MYFKGKNSGTFYTREKSIHTVALIVKMIASLIRTKQIAFPDTFRKTLKLMCGYVRP